MANLVTKVLTFQAQHASCGEDENESKFHGSNMIKWLDDSLKEKKITEFFFEIQDSFEKQSSLFDCYFKKCPLNLRHRTTGRCETETDI